MKSIFIAKPLNPGTVMKLRWLVRLLLLLLLCVVTWLALTPKPPEAANLFGWDKANHVFAFFLLASFVDYSVVRSAVIPWLGLLAYGIGIEICQFLTGDRMFEFSDMLADAVGIMLYVAVSPIGRNIPALGYLKEQTK